jgi:hypothetical protein
MDGTNSIDDIKNDLVKEFDYSIDDICARITDFFNCFWKEGIVELKYDA